MSNQWVECPNRKHSMMKDNVICPLCLYETTNLIGKCLFKPECPECEKKQSFCGGIEMSECTEYSSEYQPIREG